MILHDSQRLKKVSKFLAKVNLRNKSPPHLIEEQGRGGTEITKKQCEFYVALRYLCLVSFEGVEVETKMTQGTRTLGQVSRSTLALWEVRREQFSSPCCLSPPPSVHSKPNNETFDISLHAKERFKNLCMARGVRLMPRFVDGFVFQNFMCTKSKQK